MARPANYRIGLAREAGERDRLAANRCPRCGGEVTFRAQIAAPGYGQSWECTGCGTAFWRRTSGAPLVDYRDLEAPPELSPEDVR